MKVAVKELNLTEYNTTLTSINLSFFLLFLMEKKITLPFHNNHITDLAINKENSSTHITKESLVFV